MTANTPKKYSAEEWEHLSERFKTSILKTTEIAELGRNVGISWPFKGSDETPEKYITFSFEELKSVPGLIGKKKRIKDLMDILREILAFDDPFSDMMDTVEERNDNNRICKQVLKKLKIPEDYPVNLMYFSPQAKELLNSKGINTLIEAIGFGRQTSTLPEGNDLSSFINGLALTNETTIRQHLPFRIGEFGLHLPEAVGLFVCGLDAPVKNELLSQSGLFPEDTESMPDETDAMKPSESSLKTVFMRFNELCLWFDKQTAELKALCDSSESIERYFLPIHDAETERVARALTLIHFGFSKSGKGKKNGLIGKLSRLFSR